MLSLMLLVTAHGAMAADAPAIDIPALAAKEAKRYPQPVQIGTLLGQDVVEPEEAQPVLGHVAAFAHRPDGGVDMIVQYGGLLGIGSHPIAIPVEAAALIGPYVTVLDFTPAQLDRFPPARLPPASPLDRGDVIRMGLTRPFH